MRLVLIMTLLCLQQTAVAKEPSHLAKHILTTAKNFNWLVSSRRVFKLDVKERSAKGILTDAVLEDIFYNHLDESRTLVEEHFGTNGLKRFNRMQEIQNIVDNDPSIIQSVVDDLKELSIELGSASNEVKNIKEKLFDLLDF